MNNFIVVSLNNILYLRCMKNAIFIRGNVASSKNGRRNFKRRSLPSVACEKYYKISEDDWSCPLNKKKFLAMIKGKTAPYKVEFTFVRDSKRRFDYINPCQTVQDLMVKKGWIEDDNANYIIPYFAPYQYDKTNPGVYITVL